MKLVYLLALAPSVVGAQTTYWNRVQVTSDSAMIAACKTAAVLDSMSRVVADSNYTDPASVGLATNVLGTVTGSMNSKVMEFSSAFVALPTPTRSRDAAKAVHSILDLAYNALAGAQQRLAGATTVLDGRTAIAQLQSTAAQVRDQATAYNAARTVLARTLRPQPKITPLACSL